MIYIFSLIGPFILLLIERFLPYPFFIEEVYKFVLVKNSDINSKSIFLSGLFFSLSESMLYATNPIYQSEPIKFIYRFLIVTPMHLSTMFIFGFTLKNKPSKKYLQVAGLAIAILIHYIFNTLSLSTQTSL